METMQPALKNGRNVWDDMNMPLEEFEERVRRIRVAMQGEGIDVLLLYGRAFNEYGDSAYVSNLIPRLPRGTMAIVPREGQVAVFFEGSSRGIPSLQQTTWVKELRAASDVARDCAKYLKEKGLIPSTVGLGDLKRLMPHHEFQVIVESLTGCTIVDAGHIVRDLRMRKSVREQDQIKKAGSIARNCFDHILANRFEVMNERLFEALVRRQARLEGAEDFRMLIATPRDGSWRLRPPEGAVMPVEGAVLVYVACEFERYWAEAARTLTISPPSFAAGKIEGPAAVYEHALEGVRSGKNVSQLHGEIVKAANEGGFSLALEYGLGEGVGLSLHEPPVISSEDAGMLQEGMCLSLRLTGNSKETGAAIIGNTLIIEKEGAKVVT